MNIEFQKNDTTLTVLPEGHVDSNSAPRLEAELNARLDGITSLILDFAGVDYISSAGLRVVLAMDQLMVSRAGSMKIMHANEYIMKVFDVTGFLDIINVET